MPTNHEPYFYCFLYSTATLYRSSILALTRSGIVVGCFRQIIIMAEIVSTSLAISAIFVCRVP